MVVYSARWRRGDSETRYRKHAGVRDFHHSVFSRTRTRFSAGGSGRVQESATGKVWYGAGVEVLVIATLIATLAHVLALGWVRARYETMSLRAFIGLQSVVALLSAALFFVMKGSLYGAAVWIGPAAITLACYSFVFRRQTMQQG